MLIIFLSLIGLFISFHPALPKLHFTFQVAFLFMLWLLLLYMLFFMTLQLLFFPKGVAIDNVNQTLTVHYFFMRPNIILATDISEYTTTKLITRSTNYEGVLIRLKTGRKYLLDDINLSDYKPVKVFLDDSKVNFTGHEKFNNFRYFTTFFKYK